MSIAMYLDDLESRIDSGVELDLRNQWLAFIQGEFSGDLFQPQRTKQSAPLIGWPKVSINQAIADQETMLVSQFASCSHALASGSGAVLCVRANYGTSIIPSLFGVELFQMAEEHNTLPTSRPISNGKEGIRALVRQGIPSIHQRLGEETLLMGQRFVDVMQNYPKIKEHVHLYHPDFQGPMDICEVVWGSELFLDIMDEPNLVKEFLEIVTKTYSLIMREWQKIVPPTNDWSAHWGMIQPGQLMLRDDSAMNFSPAMFDEFIKPYDSRLLNEFGGGAIHFCGRGDHYIESASQIPDLYAINMSQPEYNNMETIYQNTVDKGIKLIGFSKQEASQALHAGRSFQSNLHSW